MFFPVQGNCDNRWSWTDTGLNLPLYRTCTFKGLQMFVSHGHMYWDPSSAGLVDSRFDMVITGHSHVPDLHTEIIDGKRVIFLNPGSAASIVSSESRPSPSRALTSMRADPLLLNRISA